MADDAFFDDNAFFRLKAIGFGGRNVAILAQNENGPCPLLAIANVLLLRGSIEIHPDRPQVSYEELVELVGDYLFTSNQRNAADAASEVSANAAHNLSDCVAMFPKLKRGLDINVRFTGCQDFEYTAEHIVFDLCGVRMLHGWIVDLQDKDAAAVVGRCTYNQLVEKVIECNSLIPDDEPPRSAPPAPAVPPSPLGAGAPGGAGGEAGAPAAARGPPPAYAPACDQALAADGAPEAVAASASRPTPLAPPEADGLSEAERERTVREGLIAQEFLSATASQLTYLGLAELHCAVRDNELCAFFRNNHFACLYKTGGELYVLVTDLGYLHESAVWERLDQLDGDTALCGADFAVCGTSQRQQDHELCAVVGPAHPPSHDAPVPQGDLLSAEFVGRHAAELGGAGGAEGGAPSPLPPLARARLARGEPMGSRLGSHGGAARAEPAVDSDFAMAMQLQAEMDREAALADARRQAPRPAPTARHSTSAAGTQQARPAPAARHSTSASGAGRPTPPRQAKGPGCEVM